MMAIDEARPDLQERFGVAVHSKNLVVDERTRAVDIIASMAIASMTIRADDPDGDGAIVGELAPLLWRLKAGGEDVFESRASALFASWLVLKGRMRRDRAADGAGGYNLDSSALPLAARLVHEWLHERCRSCRGCGKQEKIGDKWQAPRGMKMLRPQFRVCQSCGGTGNGKTKHHERAQLLGIKMIDYDRGPWRRLFLANGTCLDRIARRVYRPLRSATYGSSIRA